MHLFVRKLANELISLSNAVTSRDKRTNDSNQKTPEMNSSILFPAQTA